MKTKQTPGPWNVEATARGYQILSVTTLVATVPFIDGKDDAHLIAAAPDLLTALKSITESMLDSGNNGTAQAIAYARAVIARAEGK